MLYFSSVMDYGWMTAAFISIILPWHHFFLILFQDVGILTPAEPFMVSGLPEVSSLIVVVVSVREALRASNWDVFLFVFVW